MFLEKLFFKLHSLRDKENFSTSQSEMFKNVIVRSLQTGGHMNNWNDQSIDANPCPKAN